jgi:hypothetical protein
MVDSSPQSIALLDLFREWEVQTLSVRGAQSTRRGSGKAASYSLRLATSQIRKRHC